MQDKNDVKNFIDTLSLKDTIDLNQIPELDLYMDQVITLFENNLSKGKRFEDDKILTKTMINNYAKGKLLKPILNKKYSKENILLLVLIYNLKQSLSISDIKTLLDSISENNDILYFYNKFLDCLDKDDENFKQEINEMLENDATSNDILLLIMSLVNKANMYKKLAASLLDEFVAPNKETATKK